MFLLDFGRKLSKPLSFHAGLSQLTPELDPLPLTIGELAWMQYDLLILALKPLLLSGKIPGWQVDALIEDAQRDLYRPVVRPSNILHTVFALKA